MCWLFPVPSWVRDRRPFLRADPEATHIIRGLRAEDVDVVPGAADGPKWLVLED